MVRPPNEHVQLFGYADDSLGEHATNRWLVRIATFSQCAGCSDIFKQSCHHDGFARVTNTRSVYVSIPVFEQAPDDCRFLQCSRTSRYCIYKLLHTDSQV